MNNTITTGILEILCFREQALTLSQTHFFVKDNLEFLILPQVLGLQARTKIPSSFKLENN